MIEAEIKARLADPAAVRRRLDRLAHGVPQTYCDTYFDTPDRTLAASGRELRVRTIASQRGARHVLTFKDRPVDAATQSKPEFELLVDDPQVAATILAGLGYPAELAFTKDCVNYEVTRAGGQFLATLVTLPEIAGAFIEVETTATETDLDEALAAVQALLRDLGVDDTAWTTATYTDAVRAVRESA